MSRPSSMATVASFRGGLRRGWARTVSLDVGRPWKDQGRNVDTVSLLFCFSFSILISHAPFFLRGFSGIFLHERGLRRLT